jgi:outer membrane protein TolC
LYQGGALRAQVEIRSAEQKQAVADYARTGQRAFGEVEGALAAENALRERGAILDATIRDSERALELAQIQYRVGTIDLARSSTPARAVLRADIASARASGSSRSVSTSISLGGGSTSRRWNRGDAVTFRRMGELPATVRVDWRDVTK